MGIVGFDGTLNTGLTLRTIRISEGKAEVLCGVIDMNRPLKDQ